MAKYLNVQYVNKFIIGSVNDHRVEDDSEEKQVTMTIFNDELCNRYVNKFVSKTLNRAVPVSGFTKTVCGLSWLDNHLETLSPEDKEKVVENWSETKFKFGDGDTVLFL